MRSFSATAAALICSSSAMAAALVWSPAVNAADLPARKAVAVAPSVAVGSWAGPYAGINAGGGQTRNCSTYLENVTGPALVGPFGEGCQSSGFMTGGAQAGYNFQTGGFVYGAEISGNLFNSRTSWNSAHFTQDVIKISAPAFGVAAVRLGYDVSSNLVYLKGGVALKNSTFQRIVPGSGTDGWVEKADKMQTGFAIGAGVERMITSNLSLGIEYNYINYGATKVSTPTVATGPAFSISPPITAATKVKSYDQVVALRLNYYFKP